MRDYTAVQYAKLAESAYSDPPSIGDPDSSSRAHIYNDIIVFRGTDDPASLLTDIDVELVDIPHIGKIHKGFWDAVNAIHDPLMKFTPPVVVGHSLGAAMALIYAGLLCAAGHPPSAVYAFEPPRMCADEMLRGQLEARGVMCLLTRNGSDPIPQVPSWLHHAYDLSQIGSMPSLVPDIDDHLIKNVIQALAI